MLEFSEQTISIVVVLVTVAWLYRQSSSRSAATEEDGKFAYPPSPPEYHWLWKHGKALARDEAGWSHDITFLKWMKLLNSKVVSFEVPVMGRMITVGDAALAKYVLQSKSKNGGSLFPKSPTYSNVLPLIGKKSIIVMEGSEWAHQRKVFNPGFSPDYLKGIVATIAKKTDRFLEICEKDDIANDKPTNMCARAIDLTSDVIAQVAFGEDWGVNSKEDNGGMQTLVTLRDLTDCIGARRRHPLLRLHPLHNRKISRLSVELDKDMQRLVRRRIAKIQKETDSNAPQKDILSLTLSTVLKANKEEKLSKAAKGEESSSSDVVFSDDDMECMTAQLKTFYFAGHDTTATTIAWAFWLLMMNPEALKKARDEVEEHLGKAWVQTVASGGLIPEESTTYETLQKCQYLDAISRETLRLYPPATSARYQADPDATWGNYKLGKSVIHINIYAIQRDPDLWGKDADEFRPERFLGDEGRKKINSFDFLPFSKGSRDCIGKYFALLEAKIALAALIVRFDGTVVDPDKEVYTANVTNVPMNGCLVKLVRRSEAEASVMAQ